MDIYIFFFLNCKLKCQRTIVSMGKNSVVFKKLCCVSLESAGTVVCVFEQCVAEFGALSVLVCRFQGSFNHPVCPEL